MALLLPTGGAITRGVGCIITTSFWEIYLITVPFSSASTAHGKITRVRRSKKQQTFGFMHGDVGWRGIKAFRRISEPRPPRMIALGDGGSNICRGKLNDLIGAYSPDTTLVLEIKKGYGCFLITRNATPTRPARAITLEKPGVVLVGVGVAVVGNGVGMGVGIGVCGVGIGVGAGVGVGVGVA